jgi:hypothetical protein
MTTTLTVGTNSYVNVTDATTYFADRLYSSDWDNASTDDKAKALIMATKAIDRMKMKGFKSVQAQSLEYPRAVYSYTRFIQRNIVGAAGYFYGDNLVIETAVSQNVIQATCEQAIFLLKMGENGNKRAELQAQGVKSMSLGKLSETYTVGVKDGICQQARDLLQDYLGSVVIV